MKIKAMSAILAIFPTMQEYEEFLTGEGADRVLESLIAFAANIGIISDNTRDSFQDWLENNVEHRSNPDLPRNITMEALLDNKEDFLQTGLSGRGLVARINALLDKFDIALPKISNTMLTRIKQEPADTLHKQNVLRSLAFWLGYERSELNLGWNYAALMKICHKSDRPVSAKDGVRIGLSLISRGDIIEQDIIIWLKKDLKQFIKEGLTVAPGGQWGAVRVYDITTLYVDFPKEEGIHDLSCYQQGIRNATSVGHQMAVRWALSPFASPKRFLSIGIAAGNFTTLDNYLQPLLSARLPGDPVIRVTDFARQCLLINDIRAIFNNKPKEISLFNGELLSIWWIVGLWSSIYWPFIPGLLKDEAVSNSDLLRTLLDSAYCSRSKIEYQNHTNAVTALMRSPQNTLLGVEISKTLYFRNKLWEALEILRIVLSTNPTNLSARSLRMVIYRDLGSNAIAYSVAAAHFRRAEKEAAFILSNCKALDEDFYVEFAVLRLTQAITNLRFIRKQHGKPVDFDIHIDPSSVFDFLNAAEDLFEKGMSVSPRGTRSVYLLICVRILKRILAYDQDICVNPEKPIGIPIEIARKPALDMLYAMGWLRETAPVEEQLPELDLALLKAFQTHDNAVALDTYRPTIYFCFAAVLWDFYPIRSAATGRHTVKILEKAIEIAKKNQKDKLYIYSFTRFHGEMSSLDVFIRQLSDSLAKIERCVSHLDGSRPYTQGERVQAERYLLFTHHIDHGAMHL